jgi:type I restriction enzyme S subunit
MNRNSNQTLSSRNKNYQMHLIKNAKSKGATREAITKEEIEQMKVIAPSQKLQTQFANIVTKTEALKEQYKNSLQELENLYGSLSQSALGES